MVFTPLRKLDVGETTQAHIPDELDDALEEVAVSTNPREMIAEMKASGRFTPHIKSDPHIASPRLDDCGKIAEFANGEGRIGYTHWQCGCYRSCEFCMGCRINQKQDLVAFGMRREIPDGTEPQIIYYHFTSNAQKSIKDFIHAVMPKYYLRLPQDDGSMIMFIHPQAAVTPDPTMVLEQRLLNTREVYDALDWQTLCNTPYRQRITGRLGAMSPKEPDDIMLDVVVETELLISQASKEERLAAYTEAVAATSGDNDLPKFVEDIEEQVAHLGKAMLTRTNAYLFALNRRGIAVNVVYKRVHVKINRNYTNRTWLRIISGQEIADKELVGYLKGWENLLAQQDIDKIT